MHWLDMGRYAAFIWSAYAVAAVLLIGLLVASLRSLRRREAELNAAEGESRGARRRRGSTAR